MDAIRAASGGSFPTPDLTPNKIIYDEAALLAFEVWCEGKSEVGTFEVFKTNYLAATIENVKAKEKIKVLNDKAGTQPFPAGVEDASNDNNNEDAADDPKAEVEAPPVPPAEDAPVEDPIAEATTTKSPIAEAPTTESPTTETTTAETPPPDPKPTIPMCAAMEAASAQNSASEAISEAFDELAEEEMKLMEELGAKSLNELEEMIDRSMGIDVDGGELPEEIELPADADPPSMIKTTAPATTTPPSLPEPSAPPAKDVRKPTVVSSSAPSGSPSDPDTPLGKLFGVLSGLVKDKVPVPDFVADQLEKVPDLVGSAYEELTKEPEPLTPEEIEAKRVQDEERENAREEAEKVRAKEMKVMQERKAILREKAEKDRAEMIAKTEKKRADEEKERKKKFEAAAKATAETRKLREKEESDRIAANDKDRKARQAQQEKKAAQDLADKEAAVIKASRVEAAAALARIEKTKRDREEYQKKLLADARRQKEALASMSRKPARPDVTFPPGKTKAVEKGVEKKKGMFNFGGSEKKPVEKRAVTVKKAVTVRKAVTAKKPAPPTTPPPKATTVVTPKVAKVAKVSSPKAAPPKAKPLFFFPKPPIPVPAPTKAPVAKAPANKLFDFSPKKKVVATKPTPTPAPKTKTKAAPLFNFAPKKSTPASTPTMKKVVTKAVSPAKSRFTFGAKESPSAPAPAPKAVSKPLFNFGKKTVPEAPPAKKAAPKPLFTFGSKPSVSKTAPKDDIPTLKNWKQDPKTGELVGIVSNSKQYKNGQKITTSRVRNTKKGSVVKTSSGSRYRLM